MKSFRNAPPKLVEVKDEALNIYQVRNENNLMIIRQPRRSDSSKYRRAWHDLSQESILLYKRRNVDWSTYEPKNRVNLPLYRGEIPGVLPLIMEIDGKIVGFADLMFNTGKHFIHHQIPENDVGVSIALCITDKYQDLGYASYFAKASELIARHKGAVWALGYTKTTGGMYNIRMNTGWDTVSFNRNYAAIKKCVVPDVEAKIAIEKAEKLAILEAEKQALLEAEKTTLEVEPSKIS